MRHAETPTDALASAPTAHAGSALAFEAVSFAYDGRPVLAEVSASVAPGEMVALLGPNGAGKSTLLRLAAGVLRPARGRILLGGTDLRALPRGSIARRVAVVPQDFSVQFAYTVRQIVELGRTAHTGLLGIARAADARVVDQALDETHTRHLAERTFLALSGGERQRVLVALALAQQPSLLLLDEPTAHLDIKHQVEVLDLLRRLNAERGLTVVAALHDLNLAARYFPRLILFRERILADGPPAQVLRGDLLSAVYETEVRVGILRGEDQLSVLPPAVGRATAAASAHGAAMLAHVLAGGGSGELLMHALADAGLAFSAGPLNIGDSDQVLAARLAREQIEEPPYAPISPEGLARAGERMRAARVVVLCPMPLGSGNVALLTLAAEAAEAGVPLALLEPEMSENTDNALLLEKVRARDFSGVGVAAYARLLSAGAQVLHRPADVVDYLLGVASG